MALLGIPYLVWLAIVGAYGVIAVNWQQLATALKDVPRFNYDVLSVLGDQIKAAPTLGQKWAGLSSFFVRINEDYPVPEVGLPEWAKTEGQLVAMRQLKDQLRISMDAAGAVPALPVDFDALSLDQWMADVTSLYTFGSQSMSASLYDDYVQTYEAQKELLLTAPALDAPDVTDGATLVGPDGGVITLPEEYPEFMTFSDLEGLETWWAPIQAAFQSGALAALWYPAYANHYNLEASRVGTAGAPIPVSVGKGWKAASPKQVKDNLEVLRKAGERARTIGGRLSTGAFGTVLAAGALASNVLGIKGAINNQHIKRLECQTTTAGNITDQLKVLVKVAGAGVLLKGISSEAKDGRFGSFLPGIDGLFDEITDLALNPTKLWPDDDGGDPQSRAVAMLGKKMAWGIGAHALATAGEMYSSLKNLGLHSIAGFVADLANFGPLVNAYEQPYQNAAIRRPVEWEANSRYRTTLPGMADLGMMYAKKEIPPGPIPEKTLVHPVGRTAVGDESFGESNLYDILRRQGYDDNLISIFSHHLFQDPRLAELIRIGQFYNPMVEESTRKAPDFVVKWIRQREWLLDQIGIKEDEFLEHWFYYFKTAVGGYEPADIKVVVETALRAVVRRDQTLGLDATTRMHRDGFITDETKDDLVQELWGVRIGPNGKYFKGDPVSARRRATDMRTIALLLEDSRNMILRSMGRGLISKGTAQEAMEDLGMDPLRSEFEIAKELLGLTPGVRMQLPADFEPGDVEVDATDDIRT